MLTTNELFSSFFQSAIGNLCRSAYNSHVCMFLMFVRLRSGYSLDVKFQTRARALYGLGADAGGGERDVIEKAILIM